MEKKKLPKGKKVSPKKKPDPAKNEADRFRYFDHIAKSIGDPGLAKTLKEAYPISEPLPSFFAF
jgi:hypothetical protein